MTDFSTVSPTGKTIFLLTFHLFDHCFADTPQFVTQAVQNPLSDSFKNRPTILKHTGKCVVSILSTVASYEPPHENINSGERESIQWCMNYNITVGLLYRIIVLSD